MAKKGKITVFASDYNNVAHFAPLLGIELLEKSQVGLEVYIGISYSNASDLYKLAYNVALAKSQPQTVSAVKTDGQKKK